jgi:tetratricopeptide (TPR) repeat protein
MVRVVLALVCLACAQAQSPSPQQLMQEAVQAQEAGQYDVAIKDYRLILTTYPDIPEVRSNLGAALSGAGRYAEAITEYDRALKLKPNPQVQLNLALAYYKLGQISNALEHLETAHAREPKNQQVQLLLADCYLQLGQNKKVVDLLTSAQKSDPDNPTLNYLLGTALVRNGQVTEGQVLVDKILKNGNSAEAHMLMGTTKYMVKDFAGALDELKQAVDLNPNLPDLFSYYGMALLVTGDQAGAQKAFERELGSNPNNFESNLRMGVLLRQNEDNENALKYLKQALKVRPGDPGVRYQIASMELATGQVDQACRDLENLTKDQPDFLEAHVSLATVYFRQKRKADGDRERAVVAKLNAARQATNEVAAKAAP